MFAKRPRFTNTGASTLPAGFTLVEMMVTVAIAAILAAIALPNFREFMVRQNTIEITNDLIGSINTARMEAVKRGTAVKIEAAGGDWTTGWTVSADMAHDDSFSTSISAHPAVPDSYFVQGAATGTGAGPDTEIVFSASGALVPTNSSYDFNVCRPTTVADSTQSRRITIGPGGAVSTHRNINTPASSPAGSC